MNEKKDSAQNKNRMSGLSPAQAARKKAEYFLDRSENAKEPASRIYCLYNAIGLLNGFSGIRSWGIRAGCAEEVRQLIKDVEAMRAEEEETASPRRTAITEDALRKIGSALRKAVEK